MLMPRLVENVHAGRPITLQGDDGMRFNPIHVSDAARATISAAALKSSAVINVAGPEVLSMRGVGECIGAAIGKDLIRSFLNLEMPENLREELNEQYHLTRDNILQSVYQLPYPNRFLATFAPFAHENRQEPIIKDLLDRQFNLFLKRCVLLLEDSQHLPIHFVGSIAQYFQEEIKHNAEILGLHVAKIQQDPMLGLIQYHE